MAKKEVVLTTCDTCGAEEQMPLPKGDGRHMSDPFVIPAEWLHVAANTKDKLLFERDLCPKCKRDVLAAAGMGDAQ